MPLIELYSFLPTLLGLGSSSLINFPTYREHIVQYTPGLVNGKTDLGLLFFVISLGFAASNSSWCRLGGRKEARPTASCNSQQEFLCSIRVYLVLKVMFQPRRGSTSSRILARSQNLTWQEKHSISSFAGWGGNHFGCGCSGASSKTYLHTPSLGSSCSTSSAYWSASSSDDSRVKLRAKCSKVLYQTR